MMNVCAFARLALCVAILSGGLATLPAQDNPSPATVPATDPVAVADAEKPTHYGMRHADFAQLNQAMLEVALEDAEIQALDAEVEALLARREALLVEKTISRQPALAEKLRTMQRNVAGLKRQQAEQQEQMRLFKQQNPGTGTPAAVPAN